jgi:hypothetical protein
VRKLKYDIVVIGAGASGVAAACTAGASGARVALIERSGVFGGLATSAHVGTVCGLYHQSSSLSELAGEFALGFVSRLQEAQGHFQSQHFADRLFYLPYRSPYFEGVCDRLLEENSVDTFLHSTCFAVHSNSSRRIESLDCLVWNEPTTFECAAVIDASGEGVISRILEAEMLSDDSLQAPGFVFGVSNLPTDIEEKTFNLVVLKEIVAAARSGHFPEPIVYASVVPGSLNAGSLHLKLALPFQRSGAFNELSELERFSRRRALESFEYLKANVDIFANASLSFLAPAIGVRSGTRALGLSVLRTEDVLNSKKCADPVANGLWPIEFWDGGRRAKLEYFSDYYEIPRGALQSATYSNLYFCGRGISAEAKALSSARVIGTSFATGSAAGHMACL